MGIKRRELMKKSALALPVAGIGSKAIGSAAASSPDKNWTYTDKASYYSSENHMATASNLTYYGGEWDSERQTWEHDFRIANTARHRKYEPMYGTWTGEKSIRGQHLIIDTWRDDMHFWNTDSNKYNGYYPNSSDADINYAQAAEVILDTALGSLDDYVKWAITAKNLVDSFVDLGKMNHNETNISMDHSTISPGWTKASYYKHFIVDKDNDNGGNFTVDSWVNIDPDNENVGVQYTVRLYQDSASWFGSQDRSSATSSSLETSSTETYEHGGEMPDNLNPKKMSAAEKRSIGLQKFSKAEIEQIPEDRLPAAAAKRNVPTRVLEKWKQSSRSGPFFHASDLPLIVKAEPINQ